MIEYWYRALEAPRGIALRTDDRNRCRVRLYAARKRDGNPMLDLLSIILPPHVPEEVWLVRSRSEESTDAEA